MNRNQVFNHSDWHPTADGVWEVQATPPDLNGPPPFEATTHRANSTGSDPWSRPTFAPAWFWFLYQPANDNPDAALDLTADGEAHTLAEAQRRVNHIARLWRDNPTEMAALARFDRYSEHSLVTCDSCRAAHRLGELVVSDGYCDAELPDDDTCCRSRRFDGFTVDELAEAVTL